MGQGRESVWPCIPPHSGGMFHKARVEWWLIEHKKQYRFLSGKGLCNRVMSTGSSHTRALLTISRMQQIRARIPCWWLTQWQQKPSQASCWEMPAGIDTSLRVSFWDFCGLALCQNRILFKLKITDSSSEKPCFAVFITKFVGGETLTFIFSFLLCHLIWGWEGAIFSKQVLRNKVSKQDDYHFLWITVHVKSWTCYIMQKRLKWNKQKYLFAYM